MVRKPSPLSGFPELLPEQRVVEQHVLDTLRRTIAAEPGRWTRIAADIRGVS